MIVDAGDAALAFVIIALLFLATLSRDILAWRRRDNLRPEGGDPMAEEEKEDPGYHPRVFVLREEVKYIHLGPGNHHRVPFERVLRWEEPGPPEDKP